MKLAPNDQETWDRLTVVMAKNLDAVQRMTREIARMKQSPLAPDHTLQDALNLLDQAEKVKRTYGQNVHAAMRTAHALWPANPAVGHELKLAGQLLVDRGMLPL